METGSPQTCNPRLWWNGTADDHANWQQKCTGNSAGFNSWFEDRNDEPVQEHFWDPSQVFMAEIPFGYNTGFKRAYIPRFNTSIDYDNITMSDTAPDGCFTDEDDSNSIKFGYDYVDEEDSHLDWHVRTCMSSSALKTPIMNGTRDRQDFEEVFYLNISTAISWKEYHASNIFRVRARTTIGYFELPNNYNDGTHGPLLDKFPSIPDDDDDSTIDASYQFVSPSPPQTTADHPPSDSTFYTNNRDSYGEQDGFPTVLEYVNNKGPLALIYASLFGNASFPAQWSDRAYTTAMARAADGPSFPATCAAYAPLGHLLGAGGGGGVCTSYSGLCFASSSSSYNVLDCVRPRRHFNTTTGGSDGDRPHPVGVWLSTFVIDTARSSGGASAMRAALRMAAFFANEIRVTHADDASKRLRIAPDPGVGGVVGAPVVPFTGLVVGSVVLGVFVVLLLALTLFAALVPRWTERLDATAAMRVGAASAAAVSSLNEGPGGLASLKNNGWHLRGSKTRGLDAAPGFVGDAVPEGEVGRVVVGAEAPLRWGRRYEGDLFGGVRMG
ncbi:hypothetical protein DIS24_g9124 [Lasiodiplodia hormozganensis]|uniref:Uncharacterized protein n=1 Tax=Lasiodiplodia hormozganensis TaxID=869390 RepID=A0AA39XZS6_9PEZI|nr:hypothetical protein DIS24_g9124 [Lasiodiplodia hormozganensis]